MDRRFKKKMASYWSLMLRTAKSDLNHIDLNSWFDLWHTHVDWKSKGNRYPETRHDAAVLTYTVLKLAEQNAIKRIEPIQVWAIFCDNTGDNAIYYHTPNANGTPFPYTFEDVAWDISPSDELKSLPVDSQYQWGVYSSPENELIYFLRSRT